MQEHYPFQRINDIQYHVMPAAKAPRQKSTRHQDVRTQKRNALDLAHECATMK